MKVVRGQATEVFQPWRSIDSAPKDGTKVLIFVPADPKREIPAAIFAAWWDAKFTYHYSVKRGEWHDGAWTDDAVLSFGYEKFQSYNPTHWQPLPAPPA